MLCVIIEPLRLKLRRVNTFLRTFDLNQKLKEKSNLPLRLKSRKRKLSLIDPKDEPSLVSHLSTKNYISLISVVDEITDAKRNNTSMIVYQSWNTNEGMSTG